MIEDREELRDDLRTTSEELLADTRELTELEKRKLQPTTTPSELEKLSADAAELTREMARKAEIQRKLANDEDASD